MVSLNKPNIAVFPYGDDAPNKYIDRMVEAIKLAYPDSVITPFPRLRNIFKLRKCDYVWLNWFENIPKRRRLSTYLIKKGILIALNLMRIKRVVTFHNRVPHDFMGRFIDRSLYNSVFRRAHKIIVLSSDSNDVLIKKFGGEIQNKIVLVPHPTYDCVPKLTAENKNTFKILFFGLLRPYKNIETIFELAENNPDIPFTIAGSAYDKDYENQLKQKAKSISNITLLTHFLSSKEIDELIEANSILLLPYNIKSSLNSGVVIHALCKKINVIVPEIGTVTQLKNKDKIFAYTYDSPESHLKELDKQIKSAKYEYYNNIDVFNNRIEVLYDEIMSTHSPEALSQRISKIFN